MIPNILGIDLGSSGIKLIYSTEEGNVKIREDYKEVSPSGWYEALCRAAKQFDLSAVKAIGFSSQVGTYIVNGKDNISWSAQVGQEELEEVLSLESQEVFLKEISMPHPHILSYPLPRLNYFKKKYEMLTDVCMPKDFLIEKLTGNRVSDPFSWRGLANLETGTYSTYLLQKLGIEESILPSLQKPDSIAGYVTEQASKETGIPVGVPVYVGCNDFFAGLLGMGMIRSGSMFDITGTSEHLGLITDREPDLQTPVVHGPYFRHHALYGVTASSGASLKFGKGLWNLNDKTMLNCAKENAPIFLPYVNGERAPIWDANASGVFFGITSATTHKQMAYAVMEGVAFSLYHIYENMGFPEAKQITIAGGAAKNRLLCKLKASLFDIPVIILEENDTSALGAQMLAAVGFGGYDRIETAMKENCVRKVFVRPDHELTETLRRRYEIYKGLYPALKDSFAEFHAGRQNAEQCESEKLRAKQSESKKQIKKKKYKGNNRKKRK